MDTRAEIFIKQFETLSQNRKPIEDNWQAIYEVTDPENAFITKKYDPASVLDNDLLCSVARQCIPKFVAAMQGMVTPPNQRWHSLVPPTEELKNDKEVRSYLEKLTSNLFEMRYRPSAGFNDAQIKNWDNYAKPGEAVMLIDEDPGKGTVYTSVHPKDFYVILDKRRRIKKGFHKMTKAFWELTEELEAAGINPSNVLPAKILEDGQKNELMEINTINVIFHMNAKEKAEHSYVLTRVDGTKEKIEYEYWGCLLINDGPHKEIIKEQGYFSCPYTFTRFKPSLFSVHSSSPSSQSLNDINMLQRVRKSIIEGTEKAVDPILLAKSDASYFHAQAGTVIKGGIGPDGKRAVDVLDTSGNIGLGVEFENVIGKSIENNYLVTLFMMFLDRTGMTATEIRQRDFERALLMSIYAYPIESEMLEPMIHRELDIMKRMGKFPQDMPDKLKELIDNNYPFYAIQYEGEAHRAQELLEGAGIMQTLEAGAVLTQYDARIKAAFKAYTCLSKIGRVNNMPSDCIVSEKEFKGIDITQDPVSGNTTENAAMVTDRLKAGLMNTF